MRKRRDTCAALAALIGASLLAGGCGLTRRLAVGSMVPILDESVHATYRSADLQTVREAIPANLVLLRGLCASEPGNRELHAVTAQMFFSYAMGFIEDEDPARAVLLYREGAEIGRACLERRGWFREADATRPLPEADALRRMGKDDVPLLFWTVANWSGRVSLQLTDPAAVAELPRVEAYLNRLLELQPDYFMGMPHVLKGTILTFRPKMMGGDPEKGKEHFDAALRISGRRMLYFQTMVARYYCRQTLDEECFDANLREVLEAPEDLLPEYRLMNLLAREKAGRLMEKRDEYF
jgi:hypothetical protein